MPAVDPPLTPPTALSHAHNLGYLVNSGVYEMPMTMWCQMTHLDYVVDVISAEYPGPPGTAYDTDYTGTADRGGSSDDRLRIASRFPWLGPLGEVDLRASVKGTGTYVEIYPVGPPSSPFTITWDSAFGLGRLVLQTPLHVDSSGMAQVKYEATFNNPQGYQHYSNPETDDNYPPYTDPPWIDPSPPWPVATLDFADWDISGFTVDSIRHVQAVNSSGLIRATLS